MTILLRSNTAMSDPLPGTPRSPDIQSGLLYRYDPDALTGTPVATWKPSIGEGGTLTSTKPPALQTGAASGANGHNAVSFLETNSNWLESAPLPIQPGVPLSFVTVFRHSPLATTQRVFTTGMPGQPYASLLINAAGAAAVQTETGTLATDAPIASSVFHVAVVVIDGSKITLSIDGVIKSLALITGARPLTQMRFGTNSAKSGDFLRGRLALHETYARAFSAEEIQAITELNAAKYGI